MRVTIKDQWGQCHTYEVPNRKRCIHGTLVPTVDDWTECIDCEEAYQREEAMRERWLERTELIIR